MGSWLRSRTVMLACNIARSGHRFVELVAGGSGTLLGAPGPEANRAFAFHPRRQYHIVGDCTYITVAIQYLWLRFVGGIPMTRELLRYSGCVPGEGFRWTASRPAGEKRSRAQSWLLLVSQEGASVPDREHDLTGMDVVLYRVFMETAPTPEGILGFAN